MAVGYHTYFLTLEKQTPKLHTHNIVMSYAKNKILRSVVIVTGVETFTLIRAGSLLKRKEYRAVEHPQSHVSLKKWTTWCFWLLFKSSTK